jgi:uncharacterized protein YqhQ
MKKKQLDEPAGQDNQVRIASKKTTIGGQALIEGLMMIGPSKKAMAVRKPDGSIHLEELPMAYNTGATNWLFIRGSVRLFRQLVSGTKALLRSAEFVEEETAAVEPPTPVDGTPDQNLPAAAESKKTSRTRSKKAGPGKIDRFFDKHADLMLYLSASVGILFSVGLFILLPNLLTSFIRQFTGLNDKSGAWNHIQLNLIEGAIRIVIFVGYLALASRMKDIRRVWMYHGAEHKAIACYEARQDLTVENVRRFSCLHPRCGTAFLFIVIIVSIVVFSFVGWWDRWINLLIRFALVPVVAGIAYEIIRLAGRYENWLTRIIAAPGLWLQHMTTAEPDEGMLEVAIVALEAVIPQEQQSDSW